jgi:hypothetical protein
VASRGGLMSAARRAGGWRPPGGGVVSKGVQWHRQQEERGLPSLSRVHDNGASWWQRS